MLEAINYFFLVLAAVTCVCCAFGSVFADSTRDRAVLVTCAVINAAFTVTIWKMAV